MLVQRVLERTDHQCQRRAEFVTDIGEEGRLGSIDLGQRLGAAAFLLIGLGVGDGRRDLTRHQPEEASIVLVEQSEGIEADDQNARAPGFAHRMIGNTAACVGGWCHGPFGNSAPTRSRRFGNDARFMLAEHGIERPHRAIASRHNIRRGWMIAVDAAIRQPA